VPSMSSTNRPLGAENEPTATAAAAGAVAVDSPPPALRPGAEFEAQAQALVAAFAKEAAIEEACLASAHRATLEGEAACSRWEAALLVAERDARAVEARQARLAEAEDYDGAEALSGQVETLAADAEVKRIFDVIGVHEVISGEAKFFDRCSHFLVCFSSLAGRAAWLSERSRASVRGPAQRHRRSHAATAKFGGARGRSRRMRGKPQRSMPERS
jgi:hypothetical protein